MGWLRDNWLDLFIFLLIALVAAGIVLYLTGINPFARPQGAPSPSPAPIAPRPAPPAAEGPPEPLVTVIPLPEAPREPPPATPPQPAPPPAPAVPSPAPAAPPAPAGGAFRVAVGAFADPENALRLQRELVRQGYPARLEPAGNLTRVVVGPYASEAEARRVAQALAAYGPQVYRGQGAAPPAAGQVYFQVGAFAREENALALAARLREAGLPVVLARDGVFRVRVGPVAEGERQAVRSRLEAMGLEVLEVR
ncbi:SPOR domain-containing protein [Thermus thermamylovorans]|uniref:SPOR domain-containing protein n=1 Tax=Thermus thermamylovorans TaxID=2509362 RepID=A0A4Q9B720_9DEIN|nr:SPOR domain-containing protein [Thermus thermamylovorans]TBH20882.1 SPOR domain-containing protein [Thermus thermamylovorans]